MKQILLVIDVQKGFTTRPHTYEMGKKIEQFVSKGFFDVVIATQFVNKENGPFTNFLHWHRLKEDNETELFSRSLARHTNYQFIKHTYSAWSEELINILKKENDGLLPEHLFILGIDTDCCVLATAADLFDNRIRPLVLTKYSASNGGEPSHEAAKMCLNRLIGKKHIIDREFNSKEELLEITDQFY